MQPMESPETRPTKRKVQDTEKKTDDREEAGKAADDKDAIIQKLLQRLEQKDDQIATMLSKIDMLQTKLDALSDLMLKSQSGAASTADDSNNSDL